MAWHEKLIQLANLCVPIAWLLNASSNLVSIPIVSIIFRCKLLQKHKKQQQRSEQSEVNTIEKWFALFSAEIFHVRCSILNWIYYTWLHCWLFKWPFNMADLTLFENQSAQSHSCLCYALYASTKFFECQRSNGNINATSNKTAEKKFRQIWHEFRSSAMCYNNTKQFLFQFQSRVPNKYAKSGPKVYKRSIFAASYPIVIKMCVAYRMRFFRHEQRKMK